MSREVRSFWMIRTTKYVSKRLQQGTMRADEKGTKYKPLNWKKLRNPKTNIGSSDPCLEFFHKQQKREIFSNLFTIFVFYHFLSPFWVILIKNSIYFKKGKTWNGTQTRITTTSNINSTQLRCKVPIKLLLYVLMSVVKFP